MISPSDPLFWLIALGMSVPWLIVIWQGQQIDKWQDRARAARHKLQDAEFALATRPPPPLVDADGSKIVPFAPRVIEGGMSGKHQRPAVVDIPFKGPIS